MDSMPAEQIKNSAFGKYVAVKATMKRAYIGNRRDWSGRDPMDFYGSDGRRVGLCVGWRTLRNGIYHRGYHSNGDDYDPPYLQVTDTVTALLVVFSPRENPVYVALEDAEVLG